MANNRNRLFDLARENGYKFKRQTGSHVIFTNDSGKIVVIPFHSHEITTGMIKKIEKDIRNNKNRH